MINFRLEAAEARLTFGRRKIVPRICVVDRKPHIRAFLARTLEELGFVSCECEHECHLGRVLDDRLPDLVMISAADCDACFVVEQLGTKGFAGKVLVFGAAGSPIVAAAMERGARLPLEMLPVLATPFSEEALHARVANLMPDFPPPSPVVDAGEALNGGWLELWYQPKIDVRSLSTRGVDALIRLRHPTWGIVSPASFVPDERDQNFSALSEFVIGRALTDWRRFVSDYGRIEIAVDLPTAVFQDAGSVGSFGTRMPDHPAFDGMIVQMNGADVIANLDWARDVARQLRRVNIGVSIDDLGAEWPKLFDVGEFPFTEIKVDREFVAGVADDRLRRSACRQILDLADGFGVRTVAEGVACRSDLIAVRELGFDLVQGALFAKPLPAQKFARTALRSSYPLGKMPPPV